MFVAFQLIISELTRSLSSMTSLF